MKRVGKSGRVRFKSLFRTEDSKPEMIATFLAVLEMIKLNKLFADYNEETKDFVLFSGKVEKVNG